jgi:phage protein D
VHTPRYRVTLNGAVLAGVQKISITPAYIFQVAKFSITKVFVANDPYPPSYWAATGNKTLLIGLEVSTDGKSFTTIISGNVDSHSWDWVANTLTAVGRDLGAAFLDTRTVGTYRNQSAAQIATTLAQSHGLKINATATGPLVGRTYDIDFDKTAGGDFADSTNEWDLLCRLGNQQGIIPYMQGDTLYFNPPPTTPPVYVLTLSRTAHGAVASVEGVQFERHLTVARDVIVTVQSWNSRKKRTFSATYRVTTKDASAGGGTPPHPVHYYQRTPNLTQAQCQAIAQQKALDISTHERNVTIKAPSLVVLTPLHVVQVSGTGTDYDMTYYPQTITYEIDFEGGATTSIQAKFSSAAYLYDEDTGQIVGEQA